MIDDKWALRTISDFKKIGGQVGYLLTMSLYCLYI